uniref:Large ribosomal subunit protein uL18c n=1 Tax=Prymnesium polylepis TaxID=72548 RepID=A0A7S4HF67_9EUKA
MKLSLLLAALLQLAGALQVPAIAAARVCRAAAPQMKHPEYFKRLARAEAGRLRLVVSKSNNHIYGQVVDDAKDAIVASASTMEKEVRESDGSTRDCAAATEVGKRLAVAAKAKGIEKVFFDRKGYKYHGRVAALAEGAREGGLDF